MESPVWQGVEWNLEVLQVERVACALPAEQEERSFGDKLLVKIEEALCTDRMSCGELVNDLPLARLVLHEE